MKVKVKLIRTNETKEIQINDESKVMDLLNKIELKPDTLIVMCDNKPIPIDEKLSDGQEILIMQVSSGG